MVNITLWISVVANVVCVCHYRGKKINQDFMAEKFPDGQQKRSAGSERARKREAAKGIDTTYTTFADFYKAIKGYNNVNVAKSVGADGVHLGNNDMDFLQARNILGGKIIGLTAHNVDEAAEAEKIGADYVGISPVFATSTKKDAGRPCGTAMIEKIRKKIKIPIVAIGGITKQNVASAISAGADSAAAISAVLEGDVRGNVKDFIKIIRKAKK